MADDRRRTVVVAGVAFPSLDPERGALEPCGVTVVDARGVPPAALAAVARDADGLMVDYVRCDGELIGSLRRCRVICQYGVGLDGIDVEAATAAGIVVTHTPSYCVDELADHAMALLLAVSRRITRYDRRVRAGHWDYKDGLPLHRLAGSTLGLVGFGQVAQAVARRARGFELQVIAADPHVGDEVFTREHVERVALPALLSRANMVSIHAALTSETRHLIGARELERLRPGAIVVNTARGAVCDQAALTAAVESGRLAGAGLDVLEREPPDAGDPLLRLEDVVLTPHAGFLSIESLADLQAQAADDVRRVLSGERPRFGVNTDAASARRAGRTPAGARA